MSPQDNNVLTPRSASITFQHAQGFACTCSFPTILAMPPEAVFLSSAPGQEPASQQGCKTLQGPYALICCSQSAWVPKDTSGLQGCTGKRVSALSARSKITEGGERSGERTLHAHSRWLQSPRGQLHPGTPATNLAKRPVRWAIRQILLQLLWTIELE